MRVRRAGRRKAANAYDPPMALLCGIDLGSFRSLSYVAWLEDEQFVLDEYLASREHPLPPAPGGWPPAFTGIEEFGVHTSWIETDFDNRIPPYDGAYGEPEAASHEDRQAVTVEVGGRRIEVVLPASIASAAGPAKDRRPKRERKRSTAAASGDAVSSPMQGTIVKVAVEDGATVEAGDLIVVLEAMKMEQPLNAHKAGVISGLAAEIGQTLSAGTTICSIKDSA